LLKKQTKKRIMKRLLLTIAAIFTAAVAAAQGGMWLPVLAEQRIADMQKNGFKLKAEDIYSVNKACMKDAVVLFGGGCTGEFVSKNGLIFTNHHCGRSFIQQHSTLMHDYLADGFWAKNITEELPCDGLEIQILDRMELIPESEGDMSQEGNRNAIIAKYRAKYGDKLEYSVEGFYGGNVYYIFVYKVFKDVRLVAAPPSSIGNYYSDTDNWMWPRHSGDFSVFRVYADKYNNPTDFSNANIPYKPKSHFKISLKGLNDGDFTMVFGYPGVTESYLPSCAVKYRQDVELPTRVCVRQIIMDLMEEAMNHDRQIKIDYASRYSGVENGKKKWEGAIAGLHSCDAVGRKQELEREFQKRLVNSELRGKYGNIVKAFCSIYNGTNIRASRCVTFFTESLYGLSQFKVGEQLTRLKNSMANPSSNIDNEINNVESKIRSAFDHRDSTLERRIFGAMYQIYCDSCPDFMPDNLDSLYTARNIAEAKDFVNDYYNTSLAAQLQTALQMVNECREALKLTGKKRETKIDDIVETLSHDVGVYFYEAFIRMLFQKAYFTYYDMVKAEDDMYKRYQAALLEVMPEIIPFPDANSTLRFTYGKVGGFEPRDAVIYKSFTTLDGVIAKDRPAPADYDAPSALETLHRNRDYGRYADKDGSMHVCFVASNRTTGGNSGSPVVNGNGHLVGINFDRCWEGTMSDIMYDPSICRNISVDIRYVLFLIDKLGKAGNILKELDVVD
jgi:hypothetical protein